MSEEILLNKQVSDEEIYRQLIPQISALITHEEPVISNLANVAAALKQGFDKISWVGFYLLKNEKLFLGPFQGNTACTVIEPGKGVCGTSAAKNETIIVEDVNTFPGHIACDSGSKSEIVVPLAVDGEVIGVLDLDSYELSAFNETDKNHLENICNLLVEKLDLINFVIR